MLSSNLKKLFDNGIQCPIDSLITVSKKAIQKASEATDDISGNKFFYKITRASKTSSKNNSETKEEEILREKYITPELR